MSAPLIVILVLVAIFLFGRSAAARRKRTMESLGAQVARSMQSGLGTVAGGADLGQNIADAVQKALAAQGLPTGTVSIRTSVATDAGSYAADPVAGLDRAGLGVGEVLSVSSLTGSRVATIELDAIGAPKRRVTVDLPANAEVGRGDRIYVRLDPTDPAIAALVTDLAPPTTANRLDPLVLQPMLLAHGEQGKAVVRSAESIPLPLAGVAGAGASSWRLDLEVTPRSGFPYRAEIVTTVSSPEKAARLCHAGAEVPVRYDPNDPKTVIVDGAAMGFGPPSQQAAVLDIPGLASMGTIERIKAVRERTGLGLKDAKDFVERMAVDPGAFAQMSQAAQPGQATEVSVDWASLAGLGKIEKIAAIRKQTGLGLAQAKALVDAMDGAGLSPTDRMTAMLSGRK
jgi:ribosomal protein L7/L12/type II secretory pathway pseudopilin PulG